VVLVTADVLVDVLVLRVVAGIADHALAFADRREDQPFVGEAAERGVLDRRRGRVERVDLDDPAELVGLVAVVLGGIGAATGGIEALELVVRQRLPAVAAGLAQAVAGVLARLLRILGGEVAGPVLLAGQVGA